MAKEHLMGRGRGGTPHLAQLGAVTAVGSYEELGGTEKPFL